MRLRTLFYLWLPLAISFELMMLEGPAIQGAIARLARPDLNLAAYGLTLQLSLLIESPVIMLLATAIALVKDADSYHAVRRFTINVALFCTLLTAAVAFTPLYDFVTATLMRVPNRIGEAARLPLQVMLLWSAAIGWRRFYQGVLVASGQTRLVSWGTSIRLGAAVITAMSLARWGGLSGATVGACALMAAVLTEAVATTVFALPVVRRNVLTQTGRPLSQREVFRYHAPLMATTLLTLLAMPITSAALARMDHPEQTLAASPVAFLVLMVMRGWGFAIQEITMSQASAPDSRGTLKRFARLVGAATTLATALLVLTPLLRIYLAHVIHLRPYLFDLVWIGVSVGVGMPLITALGSWARGVLLAAGRTSRIYRGMALNLLTHGLLLAVGVTLKLPGMWVASGAYSLAAFGEYIYLARCAAAIPAPEPALETQREPEFASAH